MRTRSAVTPPAAAAWVVMRMPEFVEVLQRAAREIQQPRLAQALRETADEYLAAARDYQAAVQGAAIVKLASGDELASTVSNEEAARALGVGVRMVGKLVVAGRLVRAGRGRIDKVSLIEELERRGSSEAS